MVNVIRFHVGVGVACLLASGCRDDPRIEERAQRNRQLEQQAQVLADRVANAERHARDMQVEHRTTLTGLREKWADIQAEYEGLENELRRVARERDLLVETRSALEQQLAARNSDLDGVTGLAAQWETQRRAQEARIRELETVVAAYEQELGRLANAPVRERADEVRPAPSVVQRPSREEQVGKLLIPRPDRTVSRREFAGIVQGMTEDEVVTYLGEPDSVEGRAPRWLIYERALTHAIEPETPDVGVRIQFDDRVVTRCIFP